MDALTAFLSSARESAPISPQLDEEGVNEYLVDIFGASGLDDSARTGLLTFVTDSLSGATGRELSEAILVTAEASEYCSRALSDMFASLVRGGDPFPARHCLITLKDSLTKSLPLLENYSQARKVVQLFNTISLSLDAVNYHLYLLKLQPEQLLFGEETLATTNYIKNATALSSNIQGTLRRPICTNIMIRKFLSSLDVNLQTLLSRSKDGIETKVQNSITTTVENPPMYHHIPQIMWRDLWIRVDFPPVAREWTLQKITQLQEENQPALTPNQRKTVFLCNVVRNHFLAGGIGYFNSPEYFQQLGIAPPPPPPLQVTHVRRHC